MKTGIIFFIFWVLLIPCQMVWAQPSEQDLFRQSVELYQKGEFDHSARLTIRLIRMSPQKSLYWFNLGNSAYMLKKYKSAQKYYEKVISLNGSLATPARLYLAKTQHQLRQPQESARILQELLAQNPPAGIQSEALKDLQLIESQKALESSAMAFYQAGKYDEAQNLLKSSPEPGPSADGILLSVLISIKQNQIEAAQVSLKNLRRLGGLNEKNNPTFRDLSERIQQEKGAFLGPTWLILDLSYGSSNNLFLDGESLSPVSGPLARFSLAAGFHFLQSENTNGKLSYLFNYEWPQSVPSAQIQTHTLQFPVLYKRNSFEASFSPYHQAQFFNRNLGAQRNGLAIRTRYSKDFFELGLEADASTQKATHDDYEFLTGSSNFVRPFVGAWGSFLYAQVFWTSGRDGSQDILYTDGSLLPLRNNYQGPGLRLASRFSDNATMSLDASQVSKKYLEPSLPSQKNREDLETSYALKFSYSLSRDFTVYCLGERIHNKSTLNELDIQDKNYEATTFSIGFSWTAD